MMWCFDFFRRTRFIVTAATPFRQKLLKFAVELGGTVVTRGIRRLWSVKIARTMGPCCEREMERQGKRCRCRRRGGREEGREPQGDDAVGGRKSDGGVWKDSLRRETSVGPSRAIYFPRSLTAFTLVGSKFVIRRHTSSPTFPRNDLLRRYLFTTSAEETYKQLQRKGIYGNAFLQSPREPRIGVEKEKVTRVALSLPSDGSLVRLDRRRVNNDFIGRSRKALLKLLFSPFLAENFSFFQQLNERNGLSKWKLKSWWKTDLHFSTGYISVEPPASVFQICITSNDWNHYRNVEEICVYRMRFYSKF